MPWKEKGSETDRERKARGKEEEEEGREIYCPNMSGWCV